MRIYLDNAATTAIDEQVIEAMTSMMRQQFGNPSSIHSYGREVKSAIEAARKSVSKSLNCSPSEIFFTSGGTEANNTAIACAVRDLGVTHIITSPIEHHAVIHTAEQVSGDRKIKLSLVQLDELGRVNIQHLESLLKQNEKTLVSLMHANNEIGNLLPIDEVAELCKKYGAWFHSDTVQTMGHYSFDLQKTKVDFLSCAAHKFHGPKGVGFLFIRSGVKIKPFINGGAQERNMRGGTENVYGIIGLAKAFEIANEHLEDHTKHISQLKSYMADELKKSIPGIAFNGDCMGNSLYTVLNVSLPPGDMNEMILFNLDIAGIACSGGSACSSGSDVGSHVLNALNVDPARANVRFSFSKYTTKSDIDFAVTQLMTMYPSAKLV